MEEILFKDKKYLTGVLTGFLLFIVIFVGFNRFQEKQVREESEACAVVEENDSENSVSVDVSSADEADVVEQNNANVEGYREVSVRKEMTPETPHSPELQRLALILREAERMLDRMENDIDKVKESQKTSVLGN